MKRRNALLQLSREHHQALVLTLRIAKATEANAISALIKSVPKIFASELEPHFQEEEAALLPRLAAAGESGIVQRTLEEHRQMRDLVAKLALGDGEALRQFGIALQEHVRFEERQLFPIAEDVLDDAYLDKPGFDHTMDGQDS